jgi:2-aminobenzoate-CoA ligase
MLRKARVSHALCDARLAAELRAPPDAPDLRHLVLWGDGELEGLCAATPRPSRPATPRPRTFA